MADSQDDFRDNPSIRTTPKQKISTSEDEIDLAGYLRILWKHRYFILFGSLLPALLVGLIFSLLPEKCSLTYIYDIEQDREILADRLYDAQEVEKLISKAQEIKPYEYKVLLERFYSSENMNRLAVQFKKISNYEYPPDLSKTNIKLDVSGELLTLTIIDSPQEKVQEISAIVRNNLEKVMPVYSVKDKLDSAISKLKNKMSDIEKNRFYLQLKLGQKRAILAKLKSLNTASSTSIPDGVVLHFNDIHDSSEYLPLAYQVQAADSNIINIEETINVNKAKYNYYGVLLGLNEMLAQEIEKQMSSYYNIEQYHSFLTALASEDKDTQLADYMSGYAKEIEYLMLMNNPLVESPGIQIIHGNNVKKATIVFVALLMIMTFMAFLMESAQKSNTQAS